MPIQLDLMPLEDKLPETPPAKTMVVRYGALKEIGEFHSDVSQKVGCGTKLVIRTDRGTEIAEMLTTTCGNGGCNKSITRDKMLEYIGQSGGRDYPFSDQGRILRVATSQDLLEQSKLDENRQKHLTMAREMVQTHRLAMKIVDVEHLLGGERILFYFVSEHRVDFRSLVRDLAHALHTRIELRQVGARDEARLTADYEKCGQHCCCKQFLKVLTPISMRSAKVQKATLDPTKISGRCGRLMCCLRYEDQTYEELRKKLPKRNTRVTTEKGDAWVIDGQILTQLVLCQFDDGTREAIPMEKITAFDRPKPVMADGRVMQTPNDRPAMMQGEMAPRRGPGGPNGPRGPGGPGMRRPQPGAPVPARPGDPLAAQGPTGGDLSAEDDDIADLLADALDDGPAPRAGAGPDASAAGPNAGAPQPAAGVDGAAPAMENAGDDPRARTGDGPVEGDGSGAPRPAGPLARQPLAPRPLPPQNRPQQQQRGPRPLPPRGPGGPQGPRGPQPGRQSFRPGPQNRLARPGSLPPARPGVPTDAPSVPSAPPSSPQTEGALPPSPTAPPPPPAQSPAVPPPTPPDAPPPGTPDSPGV